MEITIPEITFTIPNIDPTTAIIIIFVLLVFLVYWHYTLYPLLKKKRDHKRIRSATKIKSFKRKKSDFKPYISNPQSRYTDYAQACWDELNKKGTDLSSVLFLFCAFLCFTPCR